MAEGQRHDQARVTEAMVHAAIGGIVGPDRLPLGSSGRIQGIVCKGPLVQFAIEVSRAEAQAWEPVRQAAEAAAARLPGVTNVTAVLTAHRGGTPAAASPPTAAQGAGPATAPPGAKAAQLLPNVRAIVAVASGKGGVGKSTTSANLAVALTQQGLRVGLLDADIYGPSMPRMLGIRGRPHASGNAIAPMERFGLKVMSIGFLVEEETAMIWRGPMVMGALEQMMGQVLWGPLDIMVVDMPPGTGDAQLTMAQRVPLTGAVIVSTPQDIALIDARRGIQMFQKTNVPVLGLVENMSVFCCPNCGHRSEIFGHGGARREAERLGAEFLGEVPLAMPIRTLSDEGTPITVAQPDSAEAGVYRAIAARVWEKCGEVLARRSAAAPRIVME